MIERLNRTSRQVLRKMMRERGTKRWVGFLDDLFENYNTAVNEAARGTPQEIWEGKEDPDPRNIRQVSPQFEVGDVVRVEKKFDPFTKKSAAKTYTKNTYEVIKVPTRAGGGKQITVRGSKGKVLNKISYKLLKVSGKVEDRSTRAKQSEEERAKQKEREKKAEGEGRSAGARAGGGLTEGVETRSARTRAGADKKKDTGAVSSQNVVSGKRKGKDSPPPSKTKAAPKVWNVDRFIDSDRKRILVKWGGFPGAEATWEPRAKLKKDMGAQYAVDLALLNKAKREERKKSSLTSK